MLKCHLETLYQNRPKRDNVLLYFFWWTKDKNMPTFIGEWRMCIQKNNCRKSPWCSGAKNSEMQVNMGGLRYPIILKPKRGQLMMQLGRNVAYRFVRFRSLKKSLWKSVRPTIPVGKQFRTSWAAERNEMQVLGVFQLTVLILFFPVKTLSHNLSVACSKKCSTFQTRTFSRISISLCSEYHWTLSYSTNCCSLRFS